MGISSDSQNCPEMGKENQITIIKFCCVKPILTFEHSQITILSLLGTMYFIVEKKQSVMNDEIF